MIYYALAFNVGTLHGNIYIITLIAGAVEIPAYVAGTYLMDRRPFGRRWTGFIGMAGSGICSFICVFMIIFSKFSSVTKQSCSCETFKCRQNIYRLLLVINHRSLHLTIPQAFSVLKRNS